MTAATELYEKTSIWTNAFDRKEDGLDKPRDILRVAYQAFRERVALLIGQIKTELPNLTLHDITHVDALWRVASEVAGSQYDLNPAEAFVLGGTFLLHDAAHCRAAYKGGLPEIKATNEWRDATAQHGLADADLQQGTADFNAVLFDTLRVLHPQQAVNLPFAVWGDTPANGMHLLPHDELRDAYGHAIGEIAKSHWMSPHELEVFANKRLTAPTYLLPAQWTVDWLKIAVLLRVADALHMDAVRAPRFLMQIEPPTDKHSRSHWDFQARMHSIKCDPVREEVVVNSSPFPASEQTAWWLAYDTARMADRELSAAHHLLRDHGIAPLAAREVAGIRSPEMFAKHVPVQGWTPVDTEVRISQVQTLVENFGGKKLYGDEPRLALRELLQNAIDAVHACRALGGLGELEGEIEVALEPAGEGKQWLHVTDTGIGMSRYVLTSVLLDFGRSLWRSSDLRGEWSGLAATGFEAIGQFGVGVFSVFMLGEQVRVTTWRYKAKDSEGQWLLEFTNGTKQRPLLRVPLESEKLKRHGTRVSVLLDQSKLDLVNMLGKGARNINSRFIPFADTVARLAPALDIKLVISTAPSEEKRVLLPNDWQGLSPEDLLSRLYPPSKFTQDLHLFMTEVKSLDGLILGRLGVPFKYRYPNAIGVSQGLYAGEVRGNVCGLIFCRPQDDLARQQAVPMLTDSELKQWAIGQKNELNTHSKRSQHSDDFLVLAGAIDETFIVGRLGGESITLPQLSDRLDRINEIVLYEESQINSSYKENFLPTDYENFKPLPHALCHEGAYSQDRGLAWINEISHLSKNNYDRTYLGLIEEVIKQAWVGVEWELYATACIGHINGQEVVRNCTIARRASPLEI